MKAATISAFDSAHVAPVDLDGGEPPEEVKEAKEIDVSSELRPLDAVAKATSTSMGKAFEEGFSDEIQGHSGGVVKDVGETPVLMEAGEQTVSKSQSMEDTYASVFGGHEDNVDSPHEDTHEDNVDSPHEDTHEDNVDSPHEDTHEDNVDSPHEDTHEDNVDSPHEDTHEDECSGVKECGKPLHAKGLCKTCYWRQAARRRRAKAKGESLSSIKAAKPMDDVENEMDEQENECALAELDIVYGILKGMQKKILNLEAKEASNAKTIAELEEDLAKFKKETEEDVGNLYEEAFKDDEEYQRGLFPGEKVDD